MSTANNTYKRKKTNVWYEEAFAIILLTWGCFKKVIMIDNWQQWLPQPHLEKEEQKDNWNGVTTTQLCLFLSQYRKCGMSESSPVGAVFLLVQDTVGADPRPHGVEWQNAFFFYDLDMTRRAQCPLWRLSEVAREGSQSPCFYSTSLIWAFRSQREVSSLEQTVRLPG